MSSSDSAAAAMFPGGFGSAMVQSPPHDEELRRLGLLVDAGAMTPLVRMCAGAKGYSPPKDPVPPSPAKGESSHAEEEKEEVARDEASANEGGETAEGDADDDAKAEGEGGDVDADVELPQRPELFHLGGHRGEPVPRQPQVL